MEYKFKFQINDKIIDCELILSFYNKENNKNYLLFTDYSKDKDGYLNTYPYYEDVSSNELIPVTNLEELKMVNSIYEKVKATL